MSILNKLQNIDRRVLYLLVAAVITVPLVIRPAKHPSIIFDEVKNAYATLDRVPKNQIVFISCYWGPGTEAENAPQTEAIMRHLFQRGIKFALVSWDQAGNELTYQIGNRVANELHKKYGKDWVHLGYRLGSTTLMRTMIRGMGQNFPAVYNHDYFNTKLNKIAAVSGVKTSKQIGAVVEITPSPTVDLWISYFNGPNGVPLVFCPTAVMAAEAYPYLDSHQIKGMLNGVIGAVQYETLIGQTNSRTDAAATSWALSAVHIFIILLLIVGNLSYFVSRRSNNNGQGGPLA